MSDTNDGGMKSTSVTIVKSLNLCRSPMPKTFMSGTSANSLKLCLTPLLTFHICHQCRRNVMYVWHLCRPLLLTSGTNDGGMKSTSGTIVNSLNLCRLPLPKAFMSVTSAKKIPWPYLSHGIFMLKGRPLSCSRTKERD